MWKFEARVEDKQGEFTKTVGQVDSKAVAIAEGSKLIRAVYKTSWSNIVTDGTDHAAVVYTDGYGVIGYVNAWEAE